MAYRKTTVDAPDYTNIPGGLNVGSQIIVRGRIPNGEERFSINLQTGEADGSHVAFHFNPRNDEQEVVRNSYLDGEWMEEDRKTPYFPFLYGSKFTVRIVVTADCYMVMVNNQFFIQYDHRMPYQDVRCLLVTEGAEYYEATVQNQCRMPYYSEFLRGMKTGMAVRVRGYVKDDAERFAINFDCDPTGGVTGFHFNPRQDEEDVVLNTNLDGWGEEQRGFDWFPFQRGQFFDAFFLVYNNAFNIYVNEQYFTSYEFRLPLEDINFLNINGDVVLMSVDFEDPRSNDTLKPIPSGLEKDDLITVKGFFYPEGERFDINLMYGVDGDSDIALHVNPRRNEEEVVLNSRDGGDWEEEERHELPKAMKDMAPFLVEIVNKEKKFKIYINGRKLCSFRSRGKVDEIKAVSVSGEAYIHEVKLLRCVEDKFVDRIPAPLEVGSWISVTGTPDDDADCFAINLQNGDSNDYDSDVVFHFNPRFGDEETVRNTMTKEEGWGDEEREHNYFPFKLEDRFQVNFLVMEDCYRVFVNDQRYIDYPHRHPPQFVSHLMLTGEGECEFFEPEFF